MLCRKKKTSLTSGEDFLSKSKRIQTRWKSKRDTGSKDDERVSPPDSLSPSPVIAESGDRLSSSDHSACCLPPSIDDLPDELLLKIVGFIHPLSETFAHLRGTSRRMNDVSKTSCLYQANYLDLSCGRPFHFDTLLSTLRHSAATLARIDLSHSRDVTDYVLYQVARACRQVTTVDVSYCPQLTNCGLRVLANLVSLVRVDISGCPKITGRGVLLMVKLNGDSLERLDMNRCLGLRTDPLSLVDMSRYGHNLKQLHMAWGKGLEKINPLSAIDLDRLTEQLGDLESLDISHGENDDSDIEAVVANCSQLRKLKISASNIHDIALKRIGDQLLNLTFLDISDCHGVTDIGLEHLAHGCPLLEYVDVSRCFEIDGPGLEVLADAVLRLHTVIARECFDLSADTVIFISVHCKHVRHLDVAFNLGISDKTMSMIAGDRQAGEELVVVTEGCPNVLLRDDDDGDVEVVDGRGPPRFRFIDWKGMSNDAFVIWETSV